MGVLDLFKKNKDGAEDEQAVETTAEEQEVKSEPKKADPAEKIRINLEEAIVSIFANKGRIDVVSFAHLVNGFCGASLYLAVRYKDDTKKEFEVLTLKPAEEEVIPVFTTKEEAEKCPQPLEIATFDTDKLLSIICGMNQHVVLNPFSEARAIIPKDVMQKGILQEYLKKENAKKAFDTLAERQDFLGATICKFIMDCDKEQREEKFRVILAYLSKNSVWVPGVTTGDKEKLEKLANAKKGDVFKFEDLAFEPDMLQNKAGHMFFPVFSAKEEVPEEYRKKFSWVHMPFTQCCRIVKEKPEASDIVINAFSNEMILKADVLDVICSIAKENK